MRKFFLCAILAIFTLSCISQADAAPRSRFAHTKSGKIVQVKHKRKRHKHKRRHHHHRRHKAKARKTSSRTTL